MITFAGTRRNFGNRVWDQLEMHPVAALAGLYVFCVAVFLATIPLPRADGQLTGSDGSFYYAYLPTLVLDHDLDFRDEYARLLPEKIVKRLHVTSAGRYSNKYGIGCAVLWMPFFLTGHLLAVGLRAAGCEIALDGIGLIYQVPTLLGSITYGFAGILLIYRACRRFFSRATGAAAAILIWLATSLIYYTTAEPSMSHACSLFAVALFIELWLAFRPAPTCRQWVILGLSGGLLALVRPQDATWLALPVLDMLWTLKASVRTGFRRCLQGFTVFGLTAGMVYVPQLAIWHALAGPSTPTAITQARHLFRWTAPKIVPVLFSLHHGLFLWHPVLLLAAAGFLFLYRKNRSVAFLLVVGFVMQLFVIGAWHGWAGGDAFGGRMLVSSLPALALGLAALIDWATDRGALRTVCILSGLFIAWNALFFAQYRLGYISRSGAITFYELTLGKFDMLTDLWRRARMSKL